MSLRNAFFAVYDTHIAPHLTAGLAQAALDRREAALDAANPFGKVARQAREPEVDRHVKFGAIANELGQLLKDFEESQDFSGSAIVRRHDKLENSTRASWDVVFRDKNENEMGIIRLSLSDYDRDGVPDIRIAHGEDSGITFKKDYYELDAQRLDDNGVVYKKEKYGVSENVFERIIDVHRQQNLQSFDRENGADVTGYKIIHSGVQGVDDLNKDSLKGFLAGVSVMCEEGPVEAFERLKKVEQIIEASKPEVIEQRSPHAIDIAMP